MSKAKGGTGRGTGKKGWNRWQAAENRAKNSPKPYKSKGTKKPDGTDPIGSQKPARSRSKGN
ncbi:DUF3934 family protein [Paenibacillus sp. GXUN7292]|uniref:DUF3934 family protein n=1 Tax=Paenibacillus sp. GXUN7292 TaxID=3422499 RepID=UPI003D7E078E